MSKLVRFRRSFSSTSRYPLRCCVRRSRAGCVTNFQKVVDHFVNLVVEYLAISGCANRKTLQSETEKVFLRLWSQMPLASRVSDVERLLWLQLTQIPFNEQGFARQAENQPGWWKEIANFNNEQRFLLVAREMEGWSLDWLSLATRIRLPELEEELFSIRKVLLKDVLPTSNTDLEERWRDFSTCWNRQRTPRFCRSLDQAASTNPNIRIFKNTWLERRCELIEFRQNYRFSENGARLFLHQLTTRVATRERCRPPLKARLLNTIRFTPTSLSGGEHS